MKLATGKKIVCMFERERFGKFEHCIFPSFSNRRETDTRREPRRDYNDPLIAKSSCETDTTFCKRPARAEGQILSTLEKPDVFASKLQQSLRQKHFDPPIRPVPHQLAGGGRWQRIEHCATPEGCTGQVPSNVW